MLHLPPRYERPSRAELPVDFAAYKSTALRTPKQTLKVLPQRLTELTGPVFGQDGVGPGESDLTIANGGEALGQRIIVHGQIRDGDGRPIPHALVEVWQANAGGRYRHTGDNWPAPLDPHFNGGGRFATDANGDYRFTTIKPGAYPWRNHDNAWRPAHIHFSLFGVAFTQRLVTQMYFPDDPMFFQDPIFNAVPASARHRMICEPDYDATVDSWALGYRFDIVLRGAEATVFEDEQDHDA